MTVCEHCGSALDPTDTFCGVCGGFTAWTEPEPEQTTADDLSLGPGSGAEADAPQAVSPQAVASQSSESVEAVKPVGSGGPGGESRAAGKAEPFAEPRNPAAVQPGLPSFDRAPGRRPETGYVAAADDLLCTACQTSNPRGRKFCRHCGAGLFVHVPQVHRSWWRRLIARFAGWRRRRRLARKHGRWGVLLRLVVVLAVCAGIGVGADQLLHHSSSVKSTVQSHFAAPKPVNPSTATASSAAPGHPAGLAVDGASNTWWAPAAGSGTGQWLQATFAAPHTLTNVDVMLGASQEQNAFLLQARPSGLLLTATTSDGKTVVDHLTPADKTGFQQFRVLIPLTVSVRVTIESVDGAGPGRLTALAEVEFFANS